MILDRRGFLMPEVMVSLTLTVGAVSLMITTIQFYRQRACQETLEIKHHQQQFMREYQQWVNDQPSH